MPRKPQITRQVLEPLLMASGPVSATELASALGVNRSTIVRALEAGFGDELVTIGATRSTRYALRRTVFTAGDRWNVFSVDESGRSHHWADLESFQDRRWRVSWPDRSGETPEWAAAFTDAQGFWEGFPFFLADLQPQGFLGRAVAGKIARYLPVPEDPRQWSDDHTLLYLTVAGEDLPGNLIVGEDSLQRVLDPNSESRRVLSRDQRASRYPEWAANAANIEPGSSAGGEQPKFLARILDSPGDSPSPAAANCQDVLVKFSPPLDQTTGRRWADLLACEWLALQVLSEAGLAQGGAELIDAGNRRFLEVPRFDRTRQGGRRGVVSLSAIHPEADSHGISQAWIRSASELGRRGLIDTSTRTDVTRLHAFAELIGNTDRHAGNLSFWLTDRLPLRLTPAYDMSPMLWAPGPQGEIVERTFAPLSGFPSLPVADRKSGGPDPFEWAIEFWRRVARCDRISEPFREIAGNAGQAVASLQAI